jgi:transcriptional regulator with XRE-family HTH domain
MVLVAIMTKRSAVIFPKHQKVLQQLGENIKLAYKRRSYTQSQISERTGLSRLTIRKIEQGDSKVSIGHYVAVLSVLGLVEDFTQVAKDDELGRKLQDIKLMASKQDQQKGKAR